MPNSWFNYHSFGQWATMSVALVVLGLSLYSLTWQPDVRNIGPVLRVIEAVPDTSKVRLGTPYGMKLIVDKFRDDCENGQIIRHMREVNHGWFYMVQVQDALQVPMGVQNLHVKIPTQPIDPTKRELMQPGLWEITTRVIYDCPDGEAGQLIPRDYKFVSPSFRVLDPNSRDGAFWLEEGVEHGNARANRPSTYARDRGRRKPDRVQGDPGSQGSYAEGYAVPFIPMGWSGRGSAGTPHHAELPDGSCGCFVLRSADRVDRGAQEL